MRVISRKRLAEFWKKHPDSERQLRIWFKVALAADWSSLAEVRKDFGHADGVELDCGLVVTVFNVGGNKYRLITRIIYPYRRVYTKLVLTHNEYDRPNWKVKLCREHLQQ
jgi:mRNA interferase HigB